MSDPLNNADRALGVGFRIGLGMGAGALIMIGMCFGCAGFPSFYSSFNRYIDESRKAAAPAEAQFNVHIALKKAKAASEHTE